MITWPIAAGRRGDALLPDCSDVGHSTTASDAASPPLGAVEDIVALANTNLVERSAPTSESIAQPAAGLAAPPTTGVPATEHPVGEDVGQSQE